MSLIKYNLNVKIFNRKADLEWLDFILLNRQSPTLAHSYDIVIGPTADDSTSYWIKQFIELAKYSNLSRDKLLEEKNKLLNNLRPDLLPMQYFFGTPASLNTLKFCNVKRNILV